MSTPRKSGERKPKSPEHSMPADAPAVGEAIVSSRLALIVLTGAVVMVYARMLAAGFVEYDDDLYIYANPLLNPLSARSLVRFWGHAYEGLYVPLSLTIWSALSLFARAPTETRSSLGQPITLDPTVFHAANIGLHVANTVLCFVLVERLAKSRAAGLLSALVFAVHPLQVESVGWVSQLRGLSSGCLTLAALNLLVRARGIADRISAARALQAASLVMVTGAMLCKPSAAALPIVALVIDRVALRTSWRAALTTALAWAACTLPFVWISKVVQKTYPEGATLLWQRPFVAGDALAFYLFKTAAPIDLGVEYGRTPHAVLSTAWGYVAWMLPVGLLALAFIHRKRHALAWLGSLLFTAFLLPTLGLVPFAFQAHSTVADRYAYLSMLGVGLVVADAVMGSRSAMALRAAAGVVLVLAIRSFDQTGSWLDNTSFLQHTIDVNPDVAFAQNNLANILLKENRQSEAIEHLQKALDSDPGHAVAHNNLALILVQQGRLEEAEPHFRKAIELDPKYFKAYESLGALYLRQERFADAIVSLKRAVEIQPEAKALNDLGIALMRNGQPGEGLEAFQRAVAGDPGNGQYRRNLGTALTQLGRTQEASEYLGR